MNQLRINNKVWAIDITLLANFAQGNTDPVESLFEAIPEDAVLAPLKDILKKQRYERREEFEEEALKVLSLLEEELVTQVALLRNVRREEARLKNKISTLNKLRSAGLITGNLLPVINYAYPISERILDETIDPSLFHFHDAKEWAERVLAEKTAKTSEGN